VGVSSTFGLSCQLFIISLSHLALLWQVRQVVCFIGEPASRSVECADSFESRFKMVLCNVFDEGRFIFTVGVGRCVGIQYTGSFGIVSLLDW
jgi:hypothetical protein